MLSPADAAVVERDPGLPGLRILLDPVAFAERLSELYPDGGVTAVEPRYLRYKPGTSCLAAFRVTARAGSVDAYARAHDPAVQAKLEKAAQRDSAPSPLGGGITIGPEAIAVYPFPNDHELAALRALGDDEATAALLADLLPAGSAPGRRLEVLRYKPERRLVARLTGAGGPAALLRFYAQDDYERVGDNVERFETGPDLRVPARLGRSRRRRAAAFEWIEGRSLRDALLAHGGAAPDGRAVGAAIAALHAQRSSRLATVTSSAAYAESIVDAARALDAASPELAARASAVAERLARRFEVRRWRMRRAIHGDLSADQIVVGNGPIAIVDFDRAGLGDARVDLGAFRARLEYDAVAGAIAPDAVEGFAAQVLDGYRAAGGKDVTRRLPRFAAAELLRLAVEPFRTRRPDWPEQTDRLIARAEALGGSS